MKNFFIRLQKLSIVLISVFFLACEDPTNISLPIDSNIAPNSIYTDTLSIAISTVISDSAVNNRSNFVITGIANDPIFGKVKAITYLQPSLAINESSLVYGLNAGKNAIADSIQLRIVSSGLIYGDTLPRGTFNIYRLNSSMDYTKNLNGDEGLPYGSNPIATFTINSLSFKNDSAAVAVYVNLPISLAQEITKIDSVSGTTQKTFNDIFKGLVIVPTDEVKAAYSFSTGPLNSATCTLIAYWHQSGTTTVESYQFPFNGPRHTQYIFDRKGTPLEAISKLNNEISSAKTKGLTYVQSGSGISTKINFDKIINLGTNIKINKAILEFKLDESTNSKQFQRIYSYLMAEIDSKNQQLRNTSKQKLYLTPISQSITGIIGTYVDSTNSLTIDVTNFLQKVSYKKSDSNSLILIPSLLTSDGLGIISNDQLSRSVFTKPKLYLYYTK